jgi:rubrerythrin
MGNETIVQKAIKQLVEFFGTATYEEIMQVLNKAIDLSKNQKSDKWFLVGANPNHSPFDGSGENLFKCKKCGYITSKKTPYCPMCGN